MDDYQPGDCAECSWCGADLLGRSFANRRDPREKFCSKSHRDASTRAVRLLLRATPTEGFPSHELRALLAETAGSLALGVDWMFRERDTPTEGE